VANVDKAASALSYVEAMSGVSKPFVWLLFRPPWSSEICSKACIFKRLLEMADEDPADDPLLPSATLRARQLHRARLLYSAGKTMALAVRHLIDPAAFAFSLFSSLFSSSFLWTTRPSFLLLPAPPAYHGPLLLLTSCI
jgi:hypothetical protein